ncbi:type II secretion system protein GspI [Candidatus Magnetoovum chiemensis]|nr:type II secretion system protein GspI [Candidatus Magnetoovum chiemensis]
MKIKEVKVFEGFLKGNFFQQVSLIPNSLVPKAFTLLEVLIAMAIISGLLVTVIHTVNHHLSIVERHKTITIASMLAKEKLSNTPTLPEKNEKGFFPNPFKDYSYTVSVYDTTFPDIALLEIQVSKDNDTVALKKFFQKK